MLVGGWLPHRARRGPCWRSTPGPRAPRPARSPACICASPTRPSATFTADGTRATAGDGTVRFRYSNGTGKLQVIRAGSNLHIYQVQGCGGAFHDGDTVALSGSYVIMPAQTITSP